jgi:hypothetical protein
MMTEGRMVWHRDTKNGGWYTYSYDDQNVYTARQVNNPGLWRAAVNGIVLGEVSTLKLAKRLADQHHHADIRKNGSLQVHEYILRYPLGAQHG